MQWSSWQLAVPDPYYFDPSSKWLTLLTFSGLTETVPLLDPHLILLFLIQVPGKSHCTVLHRGDRIFCCFSFVFLSVASDKNIES